MYVCMCRAIYNAYWKLLNFKHIKEGNAKQHGLKNENGFSKRWSALLLFARFNCCHLNMSTRTAMLNTTQKYIDSFKFFCDTSSEEKNEKRANATQEHHHLLSFACSPLVRL